MNNNFKIGLVHLSVSLETNMIHYPNNGTVNDVDSAFIDLAGWAGDLLQAAGSLNNKELLLPDDARMTEDEIYNAINGIGEDNLFPQEDFFQDADAIVLMRDMLEKPIYEVFREYYLTIDQNKRFDKFINERALTGYLPDGITPTSDRYDIVYRLAYMYLSKEGTNAQNVLSTAFTFMQDAFSYDEEKYAEKFSKAFAQRIVDLI